GGVAVEVAPLNLGITLGEVAGVGVRVALCAHVEHGVCNVPGRVRHAHPAQRAQPVGGVVCPKVGLGEERVRRHDALGHHRARVLEVLHVPFVGVATADAREVRPGALRAPLERVVVHAFGGERVVAVALDLVAEGADHLAVAGVAAFADVDVAAGLLERGVGPHALDLLDRVVDPEQRRNLDHAADHDRNEGEHAEKRDVALDLLVLLGEAHFADSYSAGTATIGRSASGSYGASRSGASARWRPAIVSQTLATISTAPAR